MAHKVPESYASSLAALSESVELDWILRRHNLEHRRGWFLQHCAWYAHVGQSAFQVSDKEREDRLNRVRRAVASLLTELDKCDVYDPVPHDVGSELRKWESFASGWDVWLDRGLQPPTGASQKRGKYIQRAMKVAASDLEKIEGRKLPTNEIAAIAARALIDDPDGKISADSIAHL